jgi:hypothetical protein
MLSLNRPYRQALATLALSLFTVAPTLYVAQLSWRVHQPGHLREVEVELGRQLGLQVSLDGVRYPRPGEVIYKGVTLWQVEPRQKTLVEVAKADLVRMGRAGRQLTVSAEGLRLRGEGPRQALDQVGSLFQNAGRSPFDRVNLSARTCEVDLGDGGPEGLKYRLRDVAGIFRADRDAATVTASYRIVGDGPSSRCEAVLTRDRRGKAVRTSLVFRTADGLPLAARALDPFFASADWLGPKARVQGTLSLRQDGGKAWEAEFQGALTDVDLSGLVGRWSPTHRLAGRGRVEIASARWADRWVQAEGTLSTGPGTISVDLLRALKQEMNFRVSGAIEAKDSDVEFQGLGLKFAMTPDGEIRLGGGLGTAYDPNVVLVHASRYAPLAYAPEGAANVLGLIKTLAPSDPGAEVLVPFTPESQVLQRCLPVPGGLARVNGAVGN